MFLQRNNHEVVGLDNSPSALRVAEERGVEETKKLDINKLNCLKKEYDSLLLLGNNFGLLGTPQNAVDILKTLYKKATKNSVLLIGDRNPYKFNGEIHEKYFRKNLRENKLPGQLKIKLIYKDLKSNWINFLLLSPKELRKLIKKTPWTLYEILNEENKDYVGILKK